MMFLTWQQFDLAVESIANHYKDRKPFDAVFGIPRGGLCLAVALSHRLQIPLAQDVTGSNLLIVDDVYETGAAVKPYLNLPDCEVAVWFVKGSFPTASVFTACCSPLAPLTPWLVFPWEQRTTSQKEMESYYASH